MSLIGAFLKQTIYMGMPDDSVRNSVVLFQLQKPTTSFITFPLDLLQWKYLSVCRKPRQFTSMAKTKLIWGVNLVLNELKHGCQRLYEMIKMKKRLWVTQKRKRKWCPSHKLKKKPHFCFVKVVTVICVILCCMMCRTYALGKMNMFWFHIIRCNVLKVLKREGTVTAAPNFKASDDAAVLDKAIKVKGNPSDAALEHVWTWLDFLRYFWNQPFLHSNCTELILQHL